MFYIYVRNESLARDCVVSMQLTVSIHSHKHWDRMKTEFGIKAWPCYRAGGTASVKAFECHHDS